MSDFEFMDSPLWQKPKDKNRWQNLEFFYFKKWRWLRLSSFQRNHMVVLQICLPLNFFVKACIAAFSAHSNLLYDDNKYPNRTRICTCLYRNFHNWNYFIFLTLRPILATGRWFIFQAPLLDCPNRTSSNNCPFRNINPFYSSVIVRFDK